MNESDQPIEKQFREMRVQDEQLKVPEFEELYPKKSKRLSLWFPVSTAAAFALLVVIWSSLGTSGEDNIQIEIQSEVPKEPAKENSIYAWEEPTNSLLD